MLVQYGRGGSTTNRGKADEDVTAELLEFGRSLLLHNPEQAPTLARLIALRSHKPQKTQQFNNQFIGGA